MRRRARLALELGFLALVVVLWAAMHKARGIENSRSDERRSLERVIAEIEALGRTELRFREAAVVDEDNDGRGEFGFLSELLGYRPPRLSEEPSAVLHDRELVIEPDRGYGFGCAGEYFITIYLPGPGGEGAILDPSILGIYGPDRVDPDQGEQQFILYAWPRDLEWKSYTPPPVFAVDEKGVIHWCSPKLPYVGKRRPGPYAAFSDKTGEVVLGGLGRDGNFWFNLEEAHPDL